MERILIDGKQIHGSVLPSAGDIAEDKGSEIQSIEVLAPDFEGAQIRIHFIEFQVIGKDADVIMEGGAEAIGEVIIVNPDMGFPRGFIEDDFL